MRPSPVARSIRASSRWASLVPLTLLLAACATELVTVHPAMPPGSRQWIISVENRSDELAHLMVGEDTIPIGKTVGIADPARVPANTTTDVVFTVPPGRAWAIFVNPSAERGPLILAMDVPPDAEGRLPVTISVGPDGEPGAQLAPDAGPGWFGN